MSLEASALRKWRKPLVVFTPKSLLRHPKVISTLEDCARGSVERVLPESASPRQTRRVLLCTGKNILRTRCPPRTSGRDDVAIIRLEQLYPLRAGLLEQALNSCADNTPALWVQEEPANMVRGVYLHERFGKKTFQSAAVRLISRLESASPATGSSGAHKLEQAQLIRPCIRRTRAECR